MFGLGSGCDGDAVAEGGELGEVAAKLAFGVDVTGVVVGAEVVGHTVTWLIAVLVAMRQAVDALEAQLEQQFKAHPQAAILRSAPGLGPSWPGESSAKSATTLYDSPT